MKVQSALVLAYVATCTLSEKSHELKYVKRSGGKSIPFYYPSVSYSYNESTGSSFLPTSDEKSIAIGTDHLAKTLGVNASDLQITSSHKGTDGTMHVYASRLINGVPVSNQNAAVHVKNGQVVGESASFSKAANSLLPQSFAPASAQVSLEKAVKAAEAEYGIKRDSFPASNAYVEIPGNKVVYAHVFQLRDDQKQEWLQVSVDAQTGQIVHVVDYVQKATYNAIGLPKLNPLDGFAPVTNPEDSKASPNGWSSGTQTYGNNVDSHIGSLRADGGSSKYFNTKWDPSQQPTYSANKQAAIVNNFYISNVVHDIAYQYGFDEKSGNFQEDNFGRGGKGGDSVDINNQATDGTNNANFATPPDGQRPTMNMYIFDITKPNRDGALDNVIPIHEFTHGISNRLTGGPSNTNCLNDGEAGGMGEGWSDAMAIFLTAKPTDTHSTDVVMGAYVVNSAAGIRQYPYSTNTKTNPMTYNTIYSQSEVHDIGTTWATILFEMYWALVDQYGYSSNLYDATQKKGNIMAIQVMIAGMKLQPCNPTFLSARDAILQATSNYYGAEAKCVVWKAFAKRGLGYDAKSYRNTNGFKLGPECSGTTSTTISVTSSTKTTTTTTPYKTTTTSTTTTPIKTTTTTTTTAKATTTTTTTTTKTTTTTAGPKPTSNSCSHSICDTGAPLSSSCGRCTSAIISYDPYCGSTSWDSKCVDEVYYVCGYQC